MNDRQAFELVAVVIGYVITFFIIIGPTLESLTGLETLWPAAPFGAAQLWQLVSTPKGWILCFGYVPVHFGYLFLRAGSPESQSKPIGSNSVRPLPGTENDQNSY